MEHLKVQQQMMVDRQNETSIVVMSIQDAAIGRQLVAAETHAESRCTMYNPDTSFWKCVNVLVKKQDDVMERISEFTSQNLTENMISTTTKRGASEIDLCKDNISKGSDTEYDSSKAKVS